MVAASLLGAGSASAQVIRFDANAPTAKIVPFFEFEGNFGGFCGNSCGFTQTTPTVDTPLAPTDLARLPNGDFLVNTLGGTIKLVTSSGSFRGNLLTPTETGVSYVDLVRFGATSLELHPDFGTPGAFGYGKAYQIVPQIPSEATRTGAPESGIPSDFSAPQKVPYNAATNAPGSAFAFQTVVREIDLSAWVSSGYAADSLSGATAPPVRDILRVDQIENNHATYDLAFNTAGDLFITTGDGGFKEGPTHPDVPGRNRRQSAQNPNEIFGKIFRINPDATAYTTAQQNGRVGENGQYSIPNTNPYYDDTLDPRFVLPNGVDPLNDGDPNSNIANSTVFQNNDGTLDEIWAVGVRSPIRLENDRRDPTGNTIVLSDVGEGSREEATIFTPQADGDTANLGWGLFEGRITNDSSINLAPNSNTIFPQFTYDHSGSALSRFGGLVTSFDATTGGLAIQGGEVYVGDLLGAEFEDLYIASELGFHNNNSVELSRIIFGDFTVPGAFTTVNLDPNGQRFDSPLLTADDFFPGFDFNQPGIDFFGDGTRLLPDRIYGIYADDDTGELFLLGGSIFGNATISRIVPVDFELPTEGDYNDDGLISAADFTVWRDTLGETGVTAFSGADGNANGRIEEFDYSLWQGAFGGGAGSATAATVPEPTTGLLVLYSLAMLGARRSRNER